MTSYDASEGGTLAFGLDIGGTGTKGAIVDLRTGSLVSERVRLNTPQPATIDAVLETATRVVEATGWQGSIGCAFPGIVKRGVVGSAANVAEEWIGVHLGEALSSRLGVPVRALNDADAAGIAEMRLGAGIDAHDGVADVVLVLTLGTGIGSALLTGGQLVPNTELGHLELDGHNAEWRASAAALHRDDLTFETWAKDRLQPYLRHIERLFSPDLIIVGGGVSREAHRFLPVLDTKARLVAAELRQNAGIVGAAIAGI